MIGLAVAARAYARARWRMARLRDRAAIERHQSARLARLGWYLARDIPFYRGIDPARVGSWPIVDKATMLANFAAMNRAGVALDTVRAALARGEDRVEGHAIGHSTGTSGNRGYFLVSDAERYVWLGTLLAKALPDALWRRHRVALALPGFSRLYGAAGGGSRVRLGLFDLTEGVDAWAARFAAFAPDTIVAPPKVLRHLAERGLVARGTTAFAAAEVLDPVDVPAIRAATGLPVRQIYMATEGLFGVSCAHGTLHLAEDVVAFEWEALAASALVQPVVTDFTRRAQAMARYRMNDLLRLDPSPCPCGSALQAVAAVEGRRDDLFLIGATTVTPDVLRNALLDADPRIDDFRIVQTGPTAVAAAIPPGCDAAAVRAGLRVALTRLGADAAVTVSHGIPATDATKLRRVRRDWDHNQISAS
ncbi:CoF synthetase [Sphingomonas corticis]|jgi:putative adenylate-forming enzyme|uniref:CoF synthetase n=1 Tax=Sphingomonas corticis TaxID=2722791 RepID=A0ABX1CRT5_9SPHN|nr:CoF synthetase [Sphingomonas corticis]NJR78467.1 CoF synthetase [Sphingomonas corticis]